MKEKLFLVCVKQPSLRYEILKFNATNKTATLQGRHGRFEVKGFTKEKVKKDGYTLIRETQNA
jgi:hypothetical protein